MPINCKKFMKLMLINKLLHEEHISNVITDEGVDEMVGCSWTFTLTYHLIKDTLTVMKSKRLTIWG